MECAPCRLCSRSFLVEVVVLLFHVCMSLVEPAVKIHIYETLCRTLNFTSCSSLPVNAELEDAVQSAAARWVVYAKLTRYLPALVLCLFCGAWSDNIGRKVPMLFPLVGTLLSTLVYLISYADGVDALVTVVAGTLVAGLCGDVGVMTMAVYSYVVDVTEKEERTRRLGRLVAMIYFGQFVGSLLVAVLVQVASVHSIFVTAATVCCLNIVAVVTLLQESLPETTRTVVVCRPEYVAQTVRVVARRRPGSQRSHVLLIVAAIVLNQACLAGEVDVTMFFVRHRPLQWTSAYYSYYVAGGYLFSSVGAVVLLPLLASRYRIDDFSIMMAALGFKVVQVTWTSFAIETWMVYGGLPFMTVSATLVPALKSSLSKLLQEREIGKIFGLSSFGETLCTFLGAMVYPNIYAVTVHWFNGLSFIVEALVYVVIFGVVLWLSADAAAAYGSPAAGGTGVAAAPDDDAADGIVAIADDDERLDLASNPDDSAIRGGGGEDDYAYDTPSAKQAERAGAPVRPQKAAA